MNCVHSKCGNTVYTDISGLVKILCNFGIGNKSIKHGLGYLEIPRKAQYPAKYYCVSCQREVKFDEMSLVCGWCGEKKPVEKLIRLADSDGKTISDIICEDCLNEVGSRLSYHKAIPLKKTLENIWLDGE